MKSRIYRLAIFTVSIFAFATTVVAADMSIGQRYFKQSCAECHGEDGMGHGWFTEYLKSPVPPLTHLKRNNGGVFPVDRVYKIIDGRSEIKMHGPRAMPIWGATFMTQSAANEPLFSESYSESIIRARILSLIDYLSQIQE